MCHGSASHGDLTLCFAELSTLRKKQRGAGDKLFETFGKVKRENRLLFSFVDCVVLVECIDVKV